MDYGRIDEKVRDHASRCGRDPGDVTLIAVSKGRPIEAIMEVRQAGCRDFGESRLQEAKQKIPSLPNDCKWHFIGALQSNKIGQVLPLFHLIHSVDTPSLAAKISAACRRRGVSASILLQVNTSGEVSKQGLSPEAWEKYLDEINQLAAIRVEGLMTMAPLIEDEREIRSCFARLFTLRERWQKKMREPEHFHHLSMGMSHDYLIAIEEGATLLRVGTAIFEPFIEQGG